MSKLKKDTKLQRIGELDIHIGSSNQAIVKFNNRSITCGPWGLVVLDLFCQPHSMQEASDILKYRVTGARTWQELTSIIINLHEVGILVSEDSKQASLRSNPRGFDAATIHIAMLNDRVRTESFIAGIKETVKPGDIVVDIGTGTGVLAIAAAQAGAKIVYAIEATGIAKIAEENFKVNGFGDKIKLVRGWSTQVILPERADVMISEMIGNDPFGESVVELTSDAIQRMLHPEARLVPSSIKVYGLPVEIPQSEIKKYFFTKKVVNRWSEWYGINFAALAKTPVSEDFHFFINPKKIEWPILSDPVLLNDAELKTIQSPQIKSTTTTLATKSGLINGFVVYFELQLGPSVSFSLNPTKVTKSNHWDSRVWVLVEPIKVEEGTVLTVDYYLNVSGVRNGVKITT